MKIFATRVWGVRFEEIPIATFGAQGHRDRLLRLATRGDRLLFVGTKTDRTSPEYQGRLLGMAEIGFEPLRTHDIIDQSHLDPRDFDQRGNYKFPFAVALTRAWRFVTQPLLTETLSVQLSMLATPGVEQLSGDDVQIVLALEIEALDLPLGDPENGAILKRDIMGLGSAKVRRISSISAPDFLRLVTSEALPETPTDAQIAQRLFGLDPEEAGVVARFYDMNRDALSPWEKTISEAVVRHVDRSTIMSDFPQSMYANVLRAREDLIDAET